MGDQVSSFKSTAGNFSIEYYPDSLNHNATLRIQFIQPYHGEMQEIEVSGAGNAEQSLRDLRYLLSQAIRLEERK